MDLSKPVLRAILHYLVPIASFLFPGICILEFAFSQGFFSSRPSDLYSFLLLVFWAALLSSPFNMLTAICLAPIDSQASRHGLAMKDTEDYEEAHMAFPLLLLIVVMYYVLFACVHAPTDALSNLLPDVNKKGAHVFLSFLFVVPLALVISIPYRLGLIALAKKYAADA